MTGEPGHSDHRMGAPPGSDTEAEPLRDRREAIGELGEALRALVEQAASTEAPAEELRLVAAQIRKAAAPLAGHSRGRAQLPTADDLLRGIRMYNPVSGTGSALAPPLRTDVVDGVVVGTCTLGLAFEGPPMYAHGGVSALLLDQMLGYATSASGNPGMTVALHTDYRAPVPLQTPLRLTAGVTAVTGRKVTARGMIATAADPETALVEATGTFVVLRPEQASRLFSAALHPDATNPAAAHD
jgi:acyl-CoA thioesterase FadM